MPEGDLELRRFRLADAEALEALFAGPEVKRWWPHEDYDRDGGWVVEVRGELVGWVQYEEERYAWYPSVALYIALTTGLQGRGYGRRALRLAVEHFVAKGHHHFTIDPDVRRERAIRSYAAAAFKPVGVLRSYGRKPEAGWGDGLLMDLDSCVTGVELGAPVPVAQSAAAVASRNSARSGYPAPQLLNADLVALRGGPSGPRLRLRGPPAGGAGPGPAWTRGREAQRGGRPRRRA